MFNQEESSKFAKEWVNAINGDETWANLIEQSIQNTVVYKSRPLILHKHRFKLGDIKKAVGMTSNISVVNSDPYDVLKVMYEKYGDKKTICILNDSSYFGPANGFIKGNVKPEEKLCRESGLFPILSASPRYAERSEIPNIPPEYWSEVMYTPAVPFTKEYGVTDAGIICADVVSCASPNCNKVPITRMAQYEEAVRTRIEGIYVFPAIHGAKVLILGAWGCGTHKNDPKFILKTFNEVVAKCGRLYNEVVFAIPNEELYTVFSTTEE